MMSVSQPSLNATKEDNPGTDKYSTLIRPTWILQCQLPEIWGIPV